MHKFLAHHRDQHSALDARSERKLRSQPPWIQHAVIERGECTQFANASAIVVRRITELREYYNLPIEHNHHEPDLRELQPVTPVEEDWVRWVHTHGTLSLPVPSILCDGGSPCSVLEIPDGVSIWQLRNQIAVVLARNGIPVPPAVANRLPPPPPRPPGPPPPPGIAAAARPVPPTPGLAKPPPPHTPPTAAKPAPPTMGPPPPLMLMDLAPPPAAQGPPPAPEAPMMRPVARENQAQKHNKGPRPAATAEPVATAEPMATAPRGGQHHQRKWRTRPQPVEPMAEEVAAGPVEVAAGPVEVEAAAGSAAEEVAAGPMGVEVAAGPAGVEAEAGDPAEPAATVEPVAHEEQTQKQNKAPRIQPMATDPVATDPAAEGTAQPAEVEGAAEPVATAEPAGTTQPGGAADAAAGQARGALRWLGGSGLHG